MRRRLKASSAKAKRLSNHNASAHPIGCRSNPCHAPGGAAPRRDRSVGRPSRVRVGGCASGFERKCSRFANQHTYTPFQMFLFVSQSPFIYTPQSSGHGRSSRQVAVASAGWMRGPGPPRWRRRQRQLRPQRMLQRPRHLCSVVGLLLLLALVVLCGSPVSARPVGQQQHQSDDNGRSAEIDTGAGRRRPLLRALQDPAPGAPGAPAPAPAPAPGVAYTAEALVDEIKVRRTPCDPSVCVEPGRDVRAVVGPPPAHACMSASIARVTIDTHTYTSPTPVPSRPEGDAVLPAVQRLPPHLGVEEHLLLVRARVHHRRPPLMIDICASSTVIAPTPA